RADFAMQRIRTDKYQAVKLGSLSEAEDGVQETWLRRWKAEIVFLGCGRLPWITSPHCARWIGKRMCMAKWTHFSQPPVVRSAFPFTFSHGLMRRRTQAQARWRIPDTAGRPCRPRFPGPERGEAYSVRGSS